MMPSPGLQRALALADGSDSSKKVGLILNGKTLQTGEYVPRAQAREVPKLVFPSGGPYVCVAIDPDAPFGSFAFLSPILHWTKSGLKSEGGETLSADSSPTICDFAPPGPPPGAAPHRYIFILYEQPADFDAKTFAPADGKPVGLTSRIRFDLEGFERKAKLGPPVAANYFTSN